MKYVCGGKNENQIRVICTHFADGMKVSHGPQKWPWWRLLSLSLVRIECGKPSTGWRVWFYTRDGAGHAGVYFDRRSS